MNFAHGKIQHYLPLELFSIFLKKIKCQIWIFKNRSMNLGLQNTALHTIYPIQLSLICFAEARKKNSSTLSIPKDTERHRETPNPKRSRPRILIYK